MTDVVVVGQIARDLVLRVDELPAAGHGTAVSQRRELLGGKGANQAVGLAQLGVSVALLGVVGDDHAADLLLARARADGVDVGSVVRRAGGRTGLIVDVVDDGDNGGWRYLEDLPADVLLGERDVTEAAGLLRSARCVVVQLQQPMAGALAAATTATGLVVLDGAPAAGAGNGHLLSAAHVVRADAREAELLTGHRLDGARDALRAGRELLCRYDLSLVALGVPDGNVFVWTDGSVEIPHVDTEQVDTTGAGDALVATLTCVLCRGGGPEEAARLAVAAAATTVGHPGGRPNLTPHRLRRFLTALSPS